MRRAWAVVPLALALVSGGCGGEAKGPTEIAFVSTRDGDYAIFGMRQGGGGEHRLTREKGDPATAEGLFFQVEPAWSPDGARIAFTSRREGVSHVFVMSADGTGTRRLTSAGADDSHPSWSPDGKRIVFSRGPEGDLYVIAADGGGARRIGSDAAPERDPSWSPDGRWIAYSRRQPGTSVREIWVVRPDGSGRRRVTSLEAASLGPVWSPDGSRIAFSTDVDGSYDIYSVAADGTSLRNETTGASADFEPTWSKDGGAIVFARDGAIVALSSDGVERTLSSGRNDSSPAWRPTVGGEGR